MEREAGEAIRQLSVLIEEERQALIRGDIGRVGELSNQKSQLMEWINRPGGSEPADLQALNRDIARNQTLLQSAMEGVRAVAARLQTLRAARSSLTVYDANGQAKRFESDGKRELERRA